MADVKPIKIVEQAMDNPSTYKNAWWSKDEGEYRILMRYTHVMMKWHRDTKQIVGVFFCSRTDFNGIRYGVYKLTGKIMDKDRRIIR